jgi:hypothetical protein
MDLQTDDRLARLEKHTGRIDTRLKAVEKALQEIKILMRQHGIQRGRNYETP